MNIEQREVILVNYYFSDMRESKVRPAIIVSNNFLNNLSDDCLIVPKNLLSRDN
jgi:mRNA-degrading endonuclease toxin of MazEF toxin-antitoxin module